MQGLQIKKRETPERILYAGRLPERILYARGYAYFDALNRSANTADWPLIALCVVVSSF